MRDKKTKEEMKAARKRYKETGSIMDFMRYEYLKSGVATVNDQEQEQEQS